MEPLVKSRLVAAIKGMTKKSLALDEATLRRWWKSNPTGGPCVLVQWMHEGHLSVTVAAGTTYNDQVATKSNPDARWVCCTSYFLEALH